MYVILIYVAMLANQPVAVPNYVFMGMEGAEQCEREKRRRNTHQLGWHCIEVAV
jgi:hypothetical protein